MSDETKTEHRADLDLSFLTRQPARAGDIPNLVRDGNGNGRREAHDARDGDAKTLTVGRGIALKGDITTCETLVVEGTIEATLDGARHLEIAPSGSFTGTARVDEATISGRFDGDLTVEKSLRVTATGRVEGKIVYKQLEIENGGELHGSVSVHS